MSLRWLFTVCVFLSLVACGGGGGGGSEPPPPTTTPTQLAQICAKENPYLDDATSVIKLGELADEKKWVKAYLDDRYLWYRDMPAIDPSDVAYNVISATGKLNVGSSLNRYFSALRNPKKTTSGRLVDKFSFMLPTWFWNSYATGEALDYGWILSEQGKDSTRRVFVNYVYATTESGLAQNNDIQRGDEIISIDGVLTNDPLNKDSFNAKLNPSQTSTHVFVISRKGQSFEKTLTAKSVSLAQAESKVVTDSQGVRWGYLLFNSHTRGVESYLVKAMSDFKKQDIKQLVIDVRYNSGGYLSIASGLSYAIAGGQRASGKVFESTRFNDKRSRLNGDLFFSDRTLFGGLTYQTLNLSKVYVLTSNSTCSASESLINGLRGIDVSVEIIGQTTCGKPYGFYPQDNCGFTYAAMEFEGVNAKGQGGYSEGFSPTCEVNDDLTHALGDPAEAMFAKAIARQQGLTCGAVSLALSTTNLKAGALDADTKLIQHDWKKNKFLVPAQ